MDLKVYTHIPGKLQVSLYIVTKFLLVLLMPITIISVISLVIPGRIGGMIFVLNLLSSTGDTIMAFYLFKTNENSYILDRKYGFDIIDELQNN